MSPGASSEFVQLDRMLHVLVEMAAPHSQEGVYAFSKMVHFILHKMTKLRAQKKTRSGGGLSRMLREQKARLYIIRRCVVMLLCYHD
ncbi:hypothetical protein GUJ93_ZPchr0010g9774 [Zizania palustris]|uniref:Uncharacterized protein n=1 Tax=Zizania palustris TaxID=103762 RepID=A0A8J5WDV1_ZIZPA|nr:hypothetical protein GUJ93_ZPchr0010g9774 [Zizania palustris]